MRKIIVLSMVSLDSVMQAPGGPDEDTSNGFKYGGWVAPYSDDAYNKAVEDELQPADYLLGRKTFEIWASYWPQHEEYWPGINSGKKYVFSKQLDQKDPLITGWKNSELVASVSEIKNLKNMAGPDLQVWGSSKLVQLLFEHDLVDELKLKIHPLTLGQGKKLFDGGNIPAAFEVAESLVTPKGVIIVTYIRAGEVKTGDLTV